MPFFTANKWKEICAESSDAAKINLTEIGILTIKNPYEIIKKRPKSYYFIMV